MNATWICEMSQDDLLAEIARINARMASGPAYPSADAYYDAKDRLRRFRAQLEGKREHEVDPMGFWFGRQS
jgi:hypothetical protein